MKIKSGNWITLQDGRSALVESIEKRGRSFTVAIPDGASETGTTRQTFTFSTRNI